MSEPARGARGGRRRRVRRVQGRLLGEGAGRGRVGAVAFFGYGPWRRDRSDGGGRGEGRGEGGRDETRGGLRGAGGGAVPETRQG